MVKRKINNFVILCNSDSCPLRVGKSNKNRNWWYRLSRGLQTLRNHVVDDMVGTESFREHLQYIVPSRLSRLHVTRADGHLKVSALISFFK